MRIRIQEKCRDQSCEAHLGVFAHPDDETSSAGGTFALYSREGVEIFVATATRGEEGTLGTGDQVIAKEDLGAVREAELRSALKLLGVHPPMFLGYRDKEVADGDFEQLVGKVISVMERVSPDVVITFGPTGISGHEDHKAIHRATEEAFRRHNGVAGGDARLVYVAIPEQMARQFELEIEGPEVDPTVLIDVSGFMDVKLRALRMHRSQEDANQIAELFETHAYNVEGFHQAYPPAPGGPPSSSFWE